MEPQTLTARQAFRIVSPAGNDDGSDHTNYQRLERLKPTPKAARSLRVLMGVPADSRTPISIEHWEYSSGDGYMADESEDTVTVSCGKVRYRLQADNPMGRLLARINNARHHPAAQAAALLAEPESHAGSHWVLVEYDTGRTCLSRVVRAESATLALGAGGFNTEVRLNGPKEIVVRVDRAGAVAEYPYLNYTDTRFATNKERAIFQTAFAAWKQEQNTPVSAECWDSAAGGYVPTDLRTVADKLYVNISGMDRTTFRVIRDWCEAEPWPLNVNDVELLNQVSAMLFVKAQQERDLTPNTDRGIDFFTPAAVREVLRLIWADLA